MAEPKLQVFRELLKEDASRPLQLPNLENAIRAYGIDSEKAVNLILKDASQELNSESRIRELAANGAIRLARVMLDIAAKSTESEEEGLDSKAMSALIQQEEEKWKSEVEETIADTIKLLNGLRGKVNEEVIEATEKMLDEARTESDEGFYEASWEKAELAREQMENALQQLLEEQEKRREKAKQLVDAAEEEFHRKRRLASESAENTIRVILTRARELCLEEEVDFEKVQKLCNSIEEVLEGKESISQEIQKWLSEMVERPSEEEPTPKVLQEEEAKEPGVETPKQIVPAIEDSIVDALSSLDSHDIDLLLNQVLIPAGLVSPGTIISMNEQLSQDFNEAQEHYENGNYQQAYQLFLDLHEEVPIYARVGQRHTSPPLFNAVASAVAEGMYDTVINLLEGVEDRLFGNPLWNLIVAYHRGGKTQEALNAVYNWIRRAKAGGYPTVRGHYAAGLLSWQLGDLQGAKASLRTALQDDPRYVQRQLRTRGYDRIQDSPLDYRSAV